MTETTTEPKKSHRATPIPEHPAMDAIKREQALLRKLLKALLKEPNLAIRRAALARVVDQMETKPQGQIDVSEK